MKTIVLIGIVLVAAGMAQCAPVLQTMQGVKGASLLRNGDFSEGGAAQASAWQSYQKGYSAASEAGRGKSRGITCASSGQEQLGAVQTISMNRTQPSPILVRGWSKAENVSSSPDPGYSLYVDLVYDDGSPLWGESAHFHCGTHDWEMQEFMIYPARAVKTLSVYCLFRGHTGRVWFDDLAVEELAAGESLVFQGVAVQIPSSTVTMDAGRRTHSTQNGLELTMQDSRVGMVKVAGQKLSSSPTKAPGVSGFLVRDAAANSDFHDFSQGECVALGLKLAYEIRAQPSHLEVSGNLLDTTRRDRAATLVFALPIETTGWRWADDIRRDRVIQPGVEYANTFSIRCGSTGTMSLYPLGAVANDTTGVALAIDMACPAQYRIFYHADLRRLCLAFDFGLAPETRQFPGAAPFRFVVYPFDPRWGFRAAFQQLMEIFPGYFLSRAKEQGLWMPFTDISKVRGWADFGFKFHEGNNNVRFDDENSILSFRYTEPMTWWMPMPKESPRTQLEALRIRDQLAQTGAGHNRQMAEVTRQAAMLDEWGNPSLLFRDEPWCRGAVWSLNPNPQLPGPKNGASIYWNDEVKQTLYGPSAKGQLDGEYLDSLEGYVTADLNFSRAHFQNTTVPLVFAPISRQPAIFKGLAVQEFTRWIADDLHRLGKLLFANGVPYRFSFLCPWLDVMGTETDWLSGNQYRPASMPQMDLWRTMSGPKPYLLLMNTDYDRFKPELVEKYFQRSLFLGFWPGMFSHNAAENPYWENPKWYDRDRPLFKKYLPLIKSVAEAGWQPVTLATATNPSLFMERFGPGQDGKMYFTVFNDSAARQSGDIRLEATAEGMIRRPEFRELITGTLHAVANTTLSLNPQEVRLLAIETR